MLVKFISQVDFKNKKNKLPVYISISNTSPVCCCKMWAYGSRIWADLLSDNYAHFFALLGFYIMSQFHIAELARRGTVKKVTGLSPQQVGYQIGPTFNFRINTRWDGRYEGEYCHLAAKQVPIPCPWCWTLKLNFVILPRPTYEWDIDCT